jgi:hypothetical protein
MAEKKVDFAKINIELAAEQAVAVIANAADAAAKVISSSAAEAVKVVNTQNSLDHDLLIRIETRMESLRTDIKELKDGTTCKIDDHEARIQKIEKKVSGYVITLSLYSGAIATLIGIMIYHILNTMP